MKKSIAILFVLLLIVGAAHARMTVTGVMFAPQTYFSTMSSVAKDFNWSDAGYDGTIPDPATVVNVTLNSVAADGITDQTADLNTLITSTSAPAVLYFPANVNSYYFTGQIILKEGIVLRGAGSDSTELEFETDTHPAIKVRGTVGSEVSVTSGYTKGSTTLVVADGSTFTVGEGARIWQDNDDSLLDPGSAYTNEAHAVGQMVHIEAKDGNTITIDPPLYYTYNAAQNVGLSPVAWIEDVGFEDLKITRTETVGNVSSGNIQFWYARNCWVSNIESDSTQQTHIELYRSLHCEVTGSYLHGQTTVVGGRGYGVNVIEKSTLCLIENNIIYDTRHAVVLQVGATANVIGYNYINKCREADATGGVYISGHGNYPIGNLIEGNDTAFIKISDNFGASGPGNTVYRNRVRGHNWTTGVPEATGAYLVIALYSHHQNVVNNEIYNASMFFDGYVITDPAASSNNFLNILGNNYAGTRNITGVYMQNMPESLYLTAQPTFVSQWACIGGDQTLDSCTIDAKTRYDAGAGNYVAQP